MTAEQQHLEVAEGFVKDALAALRLQESALLGLQAALSAFKEAQALREQEDAARAAEEHTEADPPYLGWQPGDALHIQTMGGGR